MMFMGKTRFTVLLLMAALLVLIPESEGDPVPKPLQSPHPLCISQFALANHACSLISYEPEPAPSAMPPPSPMIPHPGFITLSQDHHGEDQDKRSHQAHHHHHHHHHHRHHHHETAAQRECCRWLKAIDDVCVCDLLLRLPVFLARPIHGYKVVVNEDCEVEYACPGRLMVQP